MVRLFLIFVFCISPLLLSTAFVWFGPYSLAGYLPVFIMFSIPVCLVTIAIAVSAIMVKASSKDVTEKPRLET
jgi:hypothetical protein